MTLGVRLNALHSLVYFRCCVCDDRIIAQNVTASDTPCHSTGRDGREGLIAHDAAGHERERVGAGGGHKIGWDQKGGTWMTATYNSSVDKINRLTEPMPVR